MVIQTYLITNQRQKAKTFEACICYYLKPNTYVSNSEQTCIHAFSLFVQYICSLKNAVDNILQIPFINSVVHKHPCSVFIWHLSQSGYCTIYFLLFCAIILLAYIILPGTAILLVIKFLLCSMKICHMKKVDWKCPVAVYCYQICV